MIYRVSHRKVLAKKRRSQTEEKEVKNQEQQTKVKSAKPSKLSYASFTRKYAMDVLAVLNGDLELARLKP